jgi:hypothetical protein
MYTAIKPDSIDQSERDCNINSPTAELAEHHSPVKFIGHILLPYLLRLATIINI